MALETNMNFSLINSSSNSQIGPDIVDIQTTELGFLAIDGGSKLQLLSSPWPAESLPPPTASLMSIASRQGILAAAGPDCIVLATTAAVRNAFGKTGPSDRHINPFSPDLKLPMEVRISHLVFSADEKYLVLSAENGGGLAVYEVSSLMNGELRPVFELSTNSQALRAISPNPAPEKGELLALVTSDGKLMIANLNTQNYTSGLQGPVLKESVSCVSWSTRGKQLVAGLGDGTAYQLTPTGEGKSQIPRPPGLDMDHYVSSITWLENHMFLFIHTPSTHDPHRARSSSFHLVTRTPDMQNYVFQKIPDPAQPFGLNRSPPHHFMLRLKEFPPNLQDVIILASTASTDIGLLTRSKAPLTNNKPREKVTGIFTMTEMSDDSRRAQLPMSASMSDTSPVGIALDLSSKDNVFQKIPDTELSNSATPLPALMVLNNEGFLVSWWIIYSESIRRGTVYPGLAVAESESSVQNNVQSPTPAGTPSSAFRPSSLAASFATSSFGPSVPSPTYTTAMTPAVHGSPSQPGRASVFGAPSSLSKQASPWSTPPALSASNAPEPSTYGSSTPAQPNNSSPFVRVPFSATSPSIFGQTSSLNPRWQSLPATSAFGSYRETTDQKSKIEDSTPTTEEPPQAPSGFAAFALKGGFAAAAAAVSAGNKTTEKTTSSIFGPSSGSGNPFIPPPSDANPLSGIQPIGNMGGFKLGSIFQSNPNPQQDDENETIKSTGLLDSTFSRDLSGAIAIPTTESTAGLKDTMHPGNTSNHSSTQLRSSTSVSNLTKPKIFPSSKSPSKAGNPSTPTEDSFPSPTTPDFSMESDTETNSRTKNPLRSSNDDRSPNGYDLSGSASQPLVNRDSPCTIKVTGATYIKEEPISESLSNSEAIPRVTPEPEKISESCDAKEIPVKKDLIFPVSEPTPQKTEQEISNSLSSTNYPSGKKDQGFSCVIGDDSNVRSRETSVAIKTADKNMSKDPTLQNSIPARSEVEQEISNLLIKEPNNFDDVDDVDNADFVDDFEDFEEGNEGDNDYNSESKIDHSSDEGSGEDLGKDLSPISEVNRTIRLSRKSSFGVIKNCTPEGKILTKCSLASHDVEPNSLFNEIKSPQTNLEKGLCSSSPIQKALNEEPKRPEPSVSENDPRTGLRTMRSRKHNSRSSDQIQISPAVYLEQQQAEERRCQELKEQKEAEEMQALVDQDDLYMQDFLSSPLEPSTQLNEFIAHSDYVNATTVDKIPAQVETVYRDINSMIDTLGLNARSLNEFILGHTEGCKEERTRDDLTDGSSWVLEEVESLSSILDNDFSQELIAGRVKDFAKKILICNDLQKDLSRFRAKYNDIQKAIATHQDPDHLAVARTQPLAPKQAAQQHDLRRDFMNLQSLLSEAEESLAVLKARIVAQDISDGKSSSSTGPTINAVLRTIAKLTKMAEKKSDDLDDLEGQIRRLKIGSPISQEINSTPVKYRASHRNSSTYGLFYSPERLKESPFQGSLVSSVGSTCQLSSPRRKLSGYTPEEKTMLRSKLARKKQVVNRLRLTLQNTGVSVRLMGNDE